MLEQMRQQSRSLLIYVLFGIVIAVFVINFGPQSEGACGRGRVGKLENNAAVIGKRVLTRQDYIYGLTMLGADRIPPQYAKMQRLHETIMDMLIDREILADQAEQQGFRVSEEDVENMIMESKVMVFGREQAIDAFKKDGIFDYERFRKFVLYQLQMSPKTFIELQRRELLAARMRDAIRLGVVVSPNEVKALWERENDKVNVEYLQFPFSKYDGLVEVKPEEVAAYAAAHEADLKKVYDERKAALYEKQPKQRRLRQILVQIKSDASPEEIAAAQKRAEGIAARLKKGENFAKVAKAVSDDERTKAKGGDLGWQRQGGSLLDPAVDAKVGAAKDGELLGPIQTSAGFYLVIAEGTREGTIDFAVAKAELAEEKLRAEKAKQKAQADAEAALAKAKAAADKPLKDLFPAPAEGATPAPTAVQANETGLFSRHGNTIPMLGSSATLAKTVFALKADAPFAGPFEEMGSFVVVKLKEHQQPNFAEFEKDKIQLTDATSSRKGLLVVNEWALQRCREVRDAKRIQVNTDMLRYEGGPEGAIRYEPCSPQSQF